MRLCCCFVSTVSSKAAYYVLEQSFSLSITEAKPTCEKRGETQRFSNLGSLDRCLEVFVERNKVVLAFMSMHVQCVFLTEKINVSDSILLCFLFFISGMTLPIRPSACAFSSSPQEGTPNTAEDQQ